MYPKNSASPEPIAIGAVVLIADGTVQTSGCTVRIKPIGVAEGDGAGTTAYSTDGIVLYTPTQAETNYTSFILIAKKASCLPVSVTVVTSASATAGHAGVDWGVVANKTTTNALTNTTIATTQKVDVETIKTQVLTAAAGITFGVYVGGTAAAAPASTALSTAQWSTARADYLDTLNTGVVLSQAAIDSIWYDDWALKSFLSDQAGGRLNSRSTHSAADVWASVTRTLTAIDEDSTTLDLDATILAALGTGSWATAIPWNAGWDAEVQSECADALNTYDPPTHAELTTALAAADDAVLAAIAALNNLGSSGAQAAAEAALAAYGAATASALAAVAADLPARITKNTALANFPFKMVLSSDHVSAGTGLTVTATRSIDGAAFAACANAASEIGGGMYKINLAAGDLNGDTITLRFAAATADTREVTIITQNT